MTWFPKVKWLQYTCKVDKCIRYSGFHIPKIIKIGQFWQSYLKNKKVDVFWGHSVVTLWLADTSIRSLIIVASSRAFASPRVTNISCHWVPTTTNDNDDDDDDFNEIPEAIAWPEQTARELITDDSGAYVSSKLLTCHAVVHCMTTISWQVTGVPLLDISWFCTPASASFQL